MMLLIELFLTAFIAVCALSAVVYAYLKNKINAFALLGTLVLGLLILLMFRCASYAALLPLLAFFGFGNLVTKYKYERKAALGVAEANKGMRSAKNVFGNGFSPLFFAFLFFSLNNPIYLLGFSASISTACADTFSTEIGQANGKPRLITNFRKVATGTNGGVTLQGLFAALLGSCLISLISLLFTTSTIWVWDVQTKMPSIEAFFIFSSLAGFLGCVVDSLLGGTLENRFQPKLNKHHVNFLATLFGGFFGIFFTLI